MQLKYRFFGSGGWFSIRGGFLHPGGCSPSGGFSIPGGCSPLGGSPSQGGVLHLGVLHLGGFLHLGGVLHRGGSPPGGSPSRGCVCVPCDLSHHAFDVTCMLPPHQLRHTNFAPAYILPGHVTCNASWDTHPPCGQTDTCKNITFANYVCGR